MSKQNNNNRNRNQRQNVNQGNNSQEYVPNYSGNVEVNNVSQQQAQPSGNYQGNYNRSFRGGRGGGFSRNQKQTRPPIDTADKPAKKDGPPAGQHLSKTTSDLKNDPLYLDAFMPSPSEELIAVAEELNHYTGFQGLTALINESYENFASKSVNFKRSVPHSAYAYYVSVMAWSRVLLLKKLNKYRISSEERDFVEIIYEQGNFVLPKSIGLYLSGFGNFDIPDGPESKFDTIAYEYEENGHFREMEENYLNATYPNISVYAQRICEDLRYTANREGGAAWNVNAIVREWNNRCLGYAPATNLNEMVCRIFQTSGIVVDGFPRDCDVFALNIRLLNNVQKFILEVPTIETVALPSSVTGSIGQMVTNIPENISLRNLPDNIGSFSFRSNSPLKLPGAPSYLSGTFLYRVDRSRNHYGFFFPYTIARVTNAQCAILDQTNRGWSPLLMGISHYMNISFKTYLRMKKVCSIDVKSI